MICARVSPHFFTPFCSFPTLLLFLPWYLQCLSCSQSNGGLHQRCLCSPPTQLSLCWSLPVSLSLSLPPTFSLFFYLIFMEPFPFFPCPFACEMVHINWACVVVVVFLDDPSGAAQNGWEVSEMMGFHVLRHDCSQISVLFKWGDVAQSWRSNL